MQIERVLNDSLKQASLGQPNKKWEPLGFRMDELDRVTSRWESFINKEGLLCQR
jgi:hypothetical protein